MELQQLIASGELDAMNLKNEVYQQLIFAATSEKFKGYQIDFNANGGSGSMDTVTEFMGGTFSLPASEFFARNGKTFAGWALAPNAEPIEAESWEIDGDTTFYAIWKDVESKEQKVPEKTDDADWVLYAGICAFAVSLIAVIIVLFHHRKSGKSKN